MVEIGEKIPEISNYEAVVVGSYIRMGVIDKKIAAFLKNNREELFQTKLGLFICSCLSDKVSDAIIKNFSEEFMDNALCIDCFGGELPEDKIKGMDKFIVNSLMKIAKTDPEFKVVTKINPEAITHFANTLKGE